MNRGNMDRDNLITSLRDLLKDTKTEIQHLESYYEGMEETETYRQILQKRHLAKDLEHEIRKLEGLVESGFSQVIDKYHEPIEPENENSIANVNRLSLPTPTNFFLYNPKLVQPPNETQRDYSKAAWTQLSLDLPSRNRYRTKSIISSQSMLENDRMVIRLQQRRRQGAGGTEERYRIVEQARLRVLHQRDRNKDEKIKKEFKEKIDAKGILAKMREHGKKDHKGGANENDTEDKKDQ